MAVLGEVGLSKPTEIQCVDMTSGVLGSHTGSRKMIFLLAPCLLFSCFLLFSMVYMHCITFYRSTFVSIRREDSSLDKDVYSINSM